MSDDQKVSFLDICKDEAKDEVADLSDWMTNLPVHLHTIPLNELAIPGSHDSGAYWLNVDEPVAPGGRMQRRSCMGEWRVVELFGRCGRNVVKNWSITQRLSIADQLKTGVRYIDMRTVYSDEHDDFFFCHGLYGVKTSTIIEDIREFLRTHPKEVLFLDFNHFYNFDDSIHLQFTKLLLDVFSGICFSCPGVKGTISEITMKDIWEAQKQVLIFYKNQTIMDGNSVFWPQRLIYSPWFNTTSVEHLVRCLNDRFKRDSREGTLNVFQAILSPHASTILCHPCSTLEGCLVRKCNEAVLGWLRDVYELRRRGTNIVICDFVTTKIAFDIIQLNKLYLEN